MSKLKLNWKKGCYEVRTVDGIDGQPYVELVKWQKDSHDREYCFTLAYFRRGNEGYSLIFVGDRPFRYLADENIKEVWYELWMTLAVLNNNFEEDNYE